MSRRSVNSSATSGNPRSAHSARAAVHVASRARSRLHEPSRWVSGSATCRRSGPGIRSSRMRSSSETRRSPTVSNSSSSSPGAQSSVRQVSTTASARSCPMCALIPASANCNGRTPGCRRNWNRGRQQAGGRRSPAAASTASRYRSANRTSSVIAACGSGNRPVSTYRSTPSVTAR
ncbi:hypothetical protein STAFG_4631 [Streptomyces afghaniensis 772]|uniref:Uncharacterized protein n=1 Tax=Streptomyces afghaniensis 772 TaxID=1283301 RepID=S4MNR7_9ACTN|nr:hypothetical protein STAFG_4631 [Streptomyces afghaniensis 772]